MLPCCMCVQVSGAPPQQPSGPHGPGSEPDQHGHEAGRVWGAAWLDKAQPQIQASSEEPHAPAGLTWLTESLLLLFKWLVWLQMNEVTRGIYSILLVQYTFVLMLNSIFLVVSFETKQTSNLKINNTYFIFCIYFVAVIILIIIYVQ